MNSKIILLFLLVLPLGLRGDSAARKTAQRVLDNLYETNGNFIFNKPKLELTDDDKNAALFMRRANKIEVSYKAVKVCRSFGKDSLDALAFLIGHELAHSYKSEMLTSQTSFLAYDKYHSEGTKPEEDADLYGLFMAYLAGYNTLELVPEIINKIYVAFGLKNKVLKNYPTFEERQKSARKVIEIADELIKIFEAGNHLLAIGQYELAGTCFEHVEQYYNGSELYNNIGVCYALSALNFSETNSEPFIFPFEISWSTRFKKPKGSRGGIDLRKEDLLKRQFFLNKASEYFQKAININSDLISAKTNLFSVLILNKNRKKAINFYKKNNLLKAADQHQNASLIKEKIRLAFALAVFDFEKMASERIWKKLSKSANYSIAQQAMHNLKIAKGVSFKNNVEQDYCANFTTLNKTFDQVKLHRPFGEFKSLAETKELEFSLNLKPNSMVYFFKKRGQIVFSLQRIFVQPEFTELKTKREIFTKRGVISVCEPLRITVLTENNSVREWAKYYGKGL